MMDAPSRLSVDPRRARAQSGLESLLRGFPEGVSGIAATDRLVEYGLSEREAMELLLDLRSAGWLGVHRGRVCLVRVP